MDNLTFTLDVRVDPDDGLVHVECRELQGCHTFGETEQEALERIAEVIIDHLGLRLRQRIDEITECTRSPSDHHHVIVIA